MAMLNNKMVCPSMSIYDYKASHDFPGRSRPTLRLAGKIVKGTDAMQRRIHCPSFDPGFQATRRGLAAASPGKTTCQQARKGPQSCWSTGRDWKRVVTEGLPCPCVVNFVQGYPKSR